MENRIQWIKDRTSFATLVLWTIHEPFKIPPTPQKIQVPINPGYSNETMIRIENIPSRTMQQPTNIFALGLHSGLVPETARARVSYIPQKNITDTGSMELF